MEPRLAERRKGVSEDRARGRLKWVLIIIAILLAVVGTAWLIRSPVLSIRSVTITGATMSHPDVVVAELGMGQGTPTIDVDAGAISAAVLEDPWVAEVSVAVGWPGTVTIAVVEHVEFAAVRAGDGWVRVAADGSVLRTEPPTDGAPLIEIDTGPVSAGYDIANPLILGALDFVEALPGDLSEGAVVETDGEGLVATVSGFTVVLGRPVEMEAKATVLAALLESGIDEGSSINLIAPLRPAVTNPQPLPEPEE
jgi:cell division protein FtsQ